MARITVEDCLKQEGLNNRFALCYLAWKRVKALRAGSTPTIPNIDNKEIVLALREIAKGKVRFMTDEEALEAQKSRQIEQEEKAAKLDKSEAAQPHRDSSPLLPPSSFSLASSSKEIEDEFFNPELDEKEKGKKSSDMQSLEDLFKVPQAFDSENSGD
jgi:DNA-directed RNA polymerase subunit omega